MPVRENFVQQDVAGEDDLRQRLTAEIQNPKTSGEPVVIVDRPNPLTTHLFVVWSEWNELEQIVRSRIILDAYADARGETEAQKVTVAMGLTSAEASRLGIK